LNEHNGHRATRPTITLDGEWRFIPDPERLFEVGTLPPRGEPIHVPGIWEAQVDRPARIITAWYRREVDIPADWRGSRALFRFGAVMYACSVWLNGRHLGDHEGGYTPFVMDGRDAIKPGQANQLVVRVVNPLNGISEFPAFAVERIQVAEELEPDLPLSEAPHGKQTWYMSMSGLWQSVCLERAERSYVANLLALPDVHNERVSLRWSIGGDAPTPGMRLAISINAPDGTVAATADLPIEGGERRGTALVGIPEPVLWDIGRPNLYRIDARLLDGDEVVDHLADRFGMREIEVSDGRVLLNGRSIYMLAALDQDVYADTIWTPPSRELLDEQLVRAKEMGFNLLRCHIKTPDPMYLDAADEAGMLLWCELPNWSKLTGTSMRRGQETLEAMFESMGNHPSIVIWTIINEDWGTQLRYEARDRLWVREMYDWLKELDPTRLAVDNSACETDETPNFHVRTDLADFHLYFGMPDNAVRWRKRIAEYAGRPAWLWSPHGDARPSGDEALILSEFGNWGLPRLDTLLEHYGRDPWWFGTGQIYYRPAGLTRRFATYGLDRMWPDVSALAEATQWHQFEALQYEIAQMRRHASIAGYVITEFADAYWEANGLLDIARNPKVFHHRLKEINAPEVVIADVERRELWGGSALNAEVILSSYDDAPPRRGRITWKLRLDDGQERDGEMVVQDWPRQTRFALGVLTVPVPDVDTTTDADLVLTAFDDDGIQRALTSLRLAVLPERARRTQRPLRVAVNDVRGIWDMRARVRELGHEVTSAADSDVLLTSEIDEAVLRYADAGGHVLVAVRTRGAVPERLDLGRRVAVHLRRGPYAGYPGQRSPWEGDWVNSFSWILPGSIPDLPERAPLDFAFEEVLPDHVMLGYDPVRHRDEVPAGMFVGWVHSPAALVWSFPQGRGSLTLTTLRIAPERGPVATVLLEGLLQRTAARGTAAAGDTVLSRIAAAVGR
jgi:hypothetical protein